MTRELKLTTANNIRTERKQFLVHGWIPLGTTTLMAGQGGEGKSTVTLGAAAKTTMGTLNGDLHGQAADVLIISPEDDPGSITVPRLKAAQADLNRVHIVSVTEDLGAMVTESVVELPTDIYRLEQAVTATGAKLIVIDPAVVTVGGNSDKVQDVRHAIGPLDALAQRHNIAVVLVAHFNKGAGNVNNKISGSHAWRDVSRSVIAFAHDPENDVRVMEVVKSNYAEVGKKLEYRLDSVDIETSSGETTAVGRAVIVGETDTSVNQIINRGFDPDDLDGDEAGQWLYDYLSQEPGEHLRKDVLKAAKSEHFSDSTIKRAAQRLDVISRRERAVHGAAVWKLPHLGHLGHDENHLGHDETRANTDKGHSGHLGHAHEPTPLGSPLDPSEPSEPRAPTSGTSRDPRETQLDPREPIFSGDTIAHYRKGA